MKKLIILAGFGLVAIFAGCGAIEGDEQISALSKIPPMQDVAIIEDAGIAQDLPVVADLPIFDIQLDTPNGQDTNPVPRHSYVVVIADTHITVSDDLEAQNARKIGEEIAKMPWPIEAVFVLGDVCYKLPYNTFQEFVDDPYDRYDIAQEIFEDYPVPVYPLIGNHDMDNGTNIPLVDVSDQLWKQHFDRDPYYSVRIGEWLFIAGNNFKGPTHDQESPEFDHDSGSMGQTQLEWMEQEMSAESGTPTVVLTHFPGYIIKDLAPFIREHRDQIKLELAGHSHAWMNLSDNFGVPSMVVGTTQFDSDCLMILELDNYDKTWRILNWDKFHWGSAYALPWDGAEQAE